jgi:SAM-dependent MidA family methyltransferase
MPFSRLRQFITSRGGAVSFQDFMAAALYDPAHGYYTRRIKTVGRGGDFATSATLSPWLGKAVAGWLRSCGPVRHVIEVGPGNGMLAEALLQDLGWWARRKLSLWLVEKSPVLQAQQRERLSKFSCVKWANSVGEALNVAGGCAAIYSNELVDAFPVLLAEWHDGRWQELWLELTAEGRLVESLRSLPEGVSSTALKENWEPMKGQRVEIPWSYHQWLAEWSTLAKSVSMLTIDYGGNFPDLYARRPAGSLRGYQRHERKQGVGIYENMGSQDLTADVCFDDLVQWGQQLGWITLSQRSQGEFLQRFAPAAKSREAEYLQRDDGAGGAFQVLEQRKSQG